MPAHQTQNGMSDLFQESDGSWLARFDSFTLHSAMQPIFQFSNGQLRPVAFEALLRPHIDGAAVLTPAFLDAVKPDDAWHVETLARTMHVRNAASLPNQAKRLFLNFDPSTLTNDGTFDNMLDELGRELVGVGILPTQCVCEITEKAPRSRADLNHFVYSLRSRGYVIAVDDFGANQSDMTRVEALTPDIVKFDGAIVKQLMETPQGYSELKKRIAELQKLRISIVLEGIEETWQIEMAESAGAEMLQGFAAAVPRLAPANFDEWFKDKQKVELSPLPVRPASA